MENADASATDSTSVALTGERNVKLHTQRRERALTRTLVLTCVAYFVWYENGWSNCPYLLRMALAF